MISKIGHDYYNGQRYDIYLVVGTACRDAEVKLFSDGEKRVCKVSVAAGKRQNTETIFARLNAWNRKSPMLSNAKKGDAVLAIGGMKTSEYNGKTYIDIDCEFAQIAGASGSIDRLAAAVNANFPTNVSAEDFEELDGEDEDLPF